VTSEIADAFAARDHTRNLKGKDEEQRGGGGVAPALLLTSVVVVVRSVPGSRRPPAPVAAVAAEPLQQLSYPYKPAAAKAESGLEAQSALGQLYSV
jgi:hypothetical protein